MRADWLDNLVWNKCLSILKNPEQIYLQSNTTVNQQQQIPNFAIELEEIKKHLKCISDDLSLIHI